MASHYYVAVSVLFATLSFSYAQETPLLPFVCELYLETSGTCDNGAHVCGEDEYSQRCSPRQSCQTTVCNPVGTQTDDAGEFICVGQFGDCVCLEDYFGNDCSQERISATCTAAQLQLTITSHNKVYTNVLYNLYFSTTTDFNFDSENPCAYEGVTRTQTVTLETGTAVTDSPPEDTCDLLPIEEEVSGQTVLSIYMYLQYSTQFQLAQDPILKISCTVGSDVAVIQSQFDVTRELSALPSTHALASGISMELKVPNDEGGYDVITQETVLNIGDPISLIVQRPANDGQVTLTNCEASSDSSFENSIHLIEDMCVASPMDALYLSDIAVVENSAGQSAEGGDPEHHVVHLPLKAFVLKGSSSIYLRCTACTANACEVQSPGCSNTVANALDVNWSTRRRRSITGSSEVDLSVSVEIQHPGYTSESNSTITGRGSGTDDNSPASVTSCYKSVGVVLPVSLLAGFLLVTMVMTFFFCTKLTNHVQVQDVNSIKKP